MRITHFWLALLLAAILTACGGKSGDDDHPQRNQYSAQVTFGDSLSDVGTYAVGAVAAARGGKYTINGDNTAINPTLTGKNWTEVIAAQLGLPPPCAAQTGLDGDASLGFSVPVTDHAGCFGYAQGGARVSNPVGARNKLTGSPLGQLTVPLTTQIANHLARTGGKFKGDEIVFVWGGGNDALALLDQLAAGATAAGQAAGAAKFGSSLTALLAAGANDPAAAAAAIGAALQTEAARPGHTDASVVQAAVTAAAQQPGNAGVADPAVYGPMVAQAQADAQSAGAAAGAKYAADNGPALVTAMGAAGAELATLVKNQIVAKGANFIVLVNLGDLANTPSSLSQPASTQELIKAMVGAFNEQLKNGVAGQPKVLLADAFAFTHDQALNPASYGLTNITTQACGPNSLQGYSLGCNGSNLIAGDVSHYLYADSVHPTPFEYALFARFVSVQMIQRGWF